MGHIQPSGHSDLGILSKQQVAPIFQESELCFQGLKQSDPRNQEREYRLFSILRPKR